MRLFAALLPPPAVVAELATAVTELCVLPEADRLRWTQPAGWHCTLAFYGAVSETVRPELHARLSRAAARARPLDLRLSGGGRFGERALWAGLAGDRERLARLAAATSAAGRRSGVPIERERHSRYHPHLTLARARGRSGARPARSGGADQGAADGSSPTSGDAPLPAVDLRPYVMALADLESTAWTASELTLVRSRLPASGQPGEQPRYEPVTSWPLGPAGGG